VSESKLSDDLSALVREAPDGRARRELAMCRDRAEALERAVRLADARVEKYQAAAVAHAEVAMRNVQLRGLLERGVEYVRSSLELFADELEDDRDDAEAFIREVEGSL
jgi:hypothetical protein